MKHGLCGQLILRITGVVILCLALLAGCSDSDGPLAPAPGDTGTTVDGAYDFTGVSGNTDTSPAKTPDLLPIYMENEVLVVLTDETESIIGAEFFNSFPLEIIRIIPCSWGTIYRLEITDSPDMPSVEEMVDILRIEPGVRIAQPNHLLYFTEAPYVPNDPMWESDDPGDDPRDSIYEQWGPAKLGASIVWNETKGDEDIIVAILDTGIRFTHEDLADNIWINVDEIPGNSIDDDSNGYIDDWRGWNCFENNNYPFDANASNYYHGTGCAGVVAAVQDNNKGISGIAPAVQVMAIRADMNDGPTCEATVCEGLNYAKDNGAHIVSMSFGVIYATEILEIECDAIWDNGNGPVLMASAGNDNNTTPLCPARYDTVICVGATVPFSRWGTPVDEQRITKNWEGYWWGSTHGPNLNIMGFGERYFSTSGVADDHYWDGVHYWFFNGTSCACPCSAGVMALIMSCHPGETGPWYWDRIEETSDDLDEPGFDDQTGHGRVNALRAVYGHDRYSDIEDTDGFVPVTGSDPCLFDSIHDRPGNPYHDTTDLYRITADSCGMMTVDLDIFTWGEDLDLALYSDVSMTGLLDESTTENHANTSSESVSAFVIGGMDYFVRVYSPAIGNSTTYGLSVDYDENDFVIIGEDITPDDAHLGTNYVPFLKLNLGVNDQATLETLSIHTYGSPDGLEWGNLKLYRDSNDNGSFDDSDELLPAVIESSGNLIGFMDLSIKWTSIVPLVLFVVADISQDALTGEPVYLGLEGPGDITLTEGYTADILAFPILSDPVTLIE